MRNDPQKYADSIGNRNAADAIAMTSRNESKNRGYNRPTVSSSIGENNVGRYMINPPLCSTALANQTKRTRLMEAR